MRTWLLLIALSACGGGQSPPDGGGGDDGGGDDGGACGKDAFIVGELIDWDSSDASFLGVNGAGIRQTFDPSFSHTTPPNGRLDFCARPDLPLEFDVDAPSEYLDGTFSLDRDVLQNGGTISLRTLTATRAASFFTEQGLTFDPNAAQIVVLSTGDRAQLTLDLAHDGARSGNDDGGGGEVTWTAGDSGRYVLFPNVAVTSSTATITGDLMGGPRDVPVSAGKLSLVATSFIFVGP